MIVIEGVAIFEEIVGRAVVHVLGKGELVCEMADGPHVAIHAPEYMVIVRVGVRGIDESVHGSCRIVLLAQQATVMITGMNVVVGIEPPPITQCLVCLRQCETVVVSLSGITVAICL